jgi:hypothetical protein
VTTLEVGQKVEQRDCGRVWELQAYHADQERWSIGLVTPGPTDRERLAGHTTTADVLWLTTYCVDWSPPVIAPPQGDGIQVMRLVDGNGLCVDENLFDSVTEMLFWTEKRFEELVDAEYGCDDLTGHWWGYEPDDNEPPNMTVQVNEMDGSLIWAEA